MNYIELSGQELARANILTTQFDPVKQKFYVNVLIIFLTQFSSSVLCFTIIVFLKSTFECLKA